MRKQMTLTLALAVAVAGAVVASTALAALGPTVVGPDGNTQAIDVKLSPKKLSRSTGTPASLKVTTKTTTTTNANGVPSPAVRAVVDFPKGVRLFAKGLPTCDAGQLQNISTDQALQLCGDAKIGSGAATALIPVGAQVFTENTTVTAFNGKPQGKKPTVLLHTYGQAPVQVTLVLNGVISNYDKQGYGPRLDIGIPLIAGGTGALTDFQTTINKKFTYKGKKRSFVTAMCANSPLKSRGAFTFMDGVTLTAKSQHGCTKKK
ncbi:MAG TPA: hypothetical protein VF176_05165 [Solirubrobacterales bacterium]